MALKLPRIFVPSNDTANFWFQMIVANVVLLINIALLYIVTQVTIPVENDAAFNIFLGNALGWMGALLAFGFPNSIGSQKQQETIQRLVEKTPPPTPAAGETTTTTTSTTAAPVAEAEVVAGVDQETAPWDRP